MNKTNALVFSAIVATTSSLYSCGPSRPQIDDNQTLNTLGFSKPITATVHNGFGGLLGSENVNLVALLAEDRLVAVNPNTVASPWFALDVSRLVSNADGFSLNIGKREILDRTDERVWSEGAVQFYAETIKYRLSLDESIKSFPIPLNENYTVRLVFQNDPVVGAWQLSDRSNLNDLSRDASEATSALSTEGAKYVGELSASIQAAIRRSYDLIERQLAQDGTLEKSNNPDVLLSRHNHLAYYLKSQALGHSSGIATVAGTLNEVTLKEIDDYCHSIDTGDHKSWHAPSRKEMDTVIAPQPAPHFIDAPDGRLWGRAPLGEQVTFMTVSVIVSGFEGLSQRSNEYRYDALPEQVTGPEYFRYVWNTAGIVIANPIPIEGVTNVAVAGSTIPGTPITLRPNETVRVICVASL